MAAGEKDLADATAIRKKETADLAATESKLADMIDTLGRSISILHVRWKKYSCGIRPSG